MDVDDLILVSVDDHVVEPPDMFDQHLPAQYKDVAPAGGAHRVGRRRLAVRGPGAAQHRAQRRGRQAARGVRHRADLVRRDAPRLLGHRRAHRATWTPTASSARCASRASRSSAASCSAGPRTRTWPWPWSGPTTTGTSTSGAAPTRAGSSRCRSRRSGIPQLMADEVHRVAAKGCHAVTFSENPEKLGWPSYHSDHWDPFWKAVSDEGTDRVPAHRLVVAAHHHVDRGARST